MNAICTECYDQLIPWCFVRVFKSVGKVALHKSKEDCWIVVNGKVLEVTKFMEEHPGGEEALLEIAGKDATREFNDIGHSSAAHKLLPKYQIGVLPGHTAQAEADSNTETYRESKRKGMSAKVIKDDDGRSSSKFAALIEFCVPLFIGASYFIYSYLTQTQKHV